MFNERKNKNEEIGEIDCLEFCDKKYLLLKKDINKSLDTSKTKLKKLLEDIEYVRNQIAHSQESTLTGDKLLTISENIDFLLNKLIVTYENL